MNELPYGLQGKVFGSGMPYSPVYDPTGTLFELYQQQGVGAVVLLAEDEECLKYTGRNLRELYADQGMKVIFLPIRDLGTPDLEALTEAVEDALSQAGDGVSIAMHCYSGVGRTGMFAACMAKRAFNLDAMGAIDWVRKSIPEAVETPEQAKIVNLFK
jgi:protein-tyrosine phosphatase